MNGVEAVEVTRRGLERARNKDQSQKLNRASVRYWKRMHWFARYHLVVAFLGGSLVGHAIVWSSLFFLGWWR